MSLSVLFFDQVSLDVFILLVAMAGLTSFFTASFGAGGGVMLLAVMAQILPPQLIIPLHGVAQLGSNAGRAVMSWRHIDWKLIGAFLPGAIFGAFIGSFVLVSLPPVIMYLTIAVFILYLCWGPKLPKMVLGAWGTVIAGAVTTLITLFAGATGPLVAAFVKQIYTDRFRTLATFATAMSLQHILKIGVFKVAGFSLAAWLPLLACMVISGAIGTWIGLRLLKRIPDKRFHQIFNIVLTLMALRLIWQSWVLL
ncbi:sulfite exporter TauE/SafE family protein [Marinomonas rhizomae]|uniref:Probable membrane transporter protein n=1 Tax=Marinomonas rhizomae TaxID=491948 RepID=A0A366J122_9GAMM|nr:sulfite exporter TauE/SafE family protein [Marinomonas rhizomae]RBP80039.1 putative membrane protein YfcA [Marinomonas rhizomae]RNF71965.1 sulfite exporter TauE/SafE family protein [Marinomonas rhizomae]